MSNSLHQMTMSYSATEDRLLLRVSTTAHDEHQIWLTRRFVKVLWPTLFKGVEKQSLPPETAAAPTTTPQVKRAVMAMQHNEALQKTDMTQQHDEEKVNKPSTEKPMLATGGQCCSAGMGSSARGRQVVGTVRWSVLSGGRYGLAVAALLAKPSCRALLLPPSGRCMKNFHGRCATDLSR